MPSVFRPVRAVHLVRRARRGYQPVPVRVLPVTASFLARTPEGRQFLHHAGNDLPTLGDRFNQPELADTLRAVANLGSQYMYTGRWGQDFVRTVQREGGKVAIDDMAQYRVIWSEPLATTFAAHQIYTAGLPGLSAFNILPALNLAEELKLDKRSPYWKDPNALRDLQRISDVIDDAPRLDSKVAAFLRGQGVDISPTAQLTKSYAKAVAPLLDQLMASARNAPRHSNAVVVIDKEALRPSRTRSIRSSGATPESCSVVLARVGEGHAGPASEALLSPFVNCQGGVGGWSPRDLIPETQTESL
jgi:gamma-glutamyltranspeptidase/glutathione hydrolase